MKQISELTIKDLYNLCKEQIYKGNGNKIVMVSDDYEGNGFHYLYYEFSTVEEAGAEEYINENIADKENTIILG